MCKYFSGLVWPESNLCGVAELLHGLQNPTSWTSCLWLHNILCKSHLRSGTLTIEINQVNTCFTFQQVLYFSSLWIGILSIHSTFFTRVYQRFIPTLLCRCGLHTWLPYWSSLSCRNMAGRLTGSEHGDTRESEEKSPFQEKHRSIYCIHVARKYTQTEWELSQISGQVHFTHRYCHDLTWYIHPG